MSVVRSRALLVAAGSMLLAAALPALAQVTVCKTPNCAAGNAGSPVLPPECQNLASPRIFTVNMDSNLLRFVPSAIRLEGHNTTAEPWDYQCIQWHKVGSTLPPWHSATDDTSLSSCDTAVACSAANAYPDPCSFETGNINNSGGPPILEWATCHYADLTPLTYHFRCRLHAANGMVGTLTVVQPVRLSVTKNGAQVTLTWTGGSTAGPWEVFRSGTNSMPSGSTTNLTPAGLTVRTFSEAPPSGNQFYLVREKN